MRECITCGGKAENAEDFTPGTILDEELCFRCNHWLSLLRGREPVFVVDGAAYQCGIYHGRHAGFKGRTFRLRRIDRNMLVITSDLNSLGLVPEEWRTFFPDNATFEWSKS